jgi:hypothetical protein
MAGHYGCADAIETSSNHLNGATLDTPYNFSNPLTGTEGGVGVPDTVTVRYMGASGVPVVVPNTDPVNVPAGHGLRQGDIVAVGDCARNEVFQITNDPTVANVLQHNANVGGLIPDNATGTLTRR